MAVSLAVIAVLKAQAGLDLTRDIAFVAGHSLGEYSALAAAGALCLADTARLLRLRGQAMQDAVAIGEGAMAALLGIDYAASAEIVREACQGTDESEVCEIANDNGGGQVVISGSLNAVMRAIGIAKGKGVKRAIQLPVSAPFHCRLMKKAAEVMKLALEGAKINPPLVPLIANVLAGPVSDPVRIRQLLVAQVTGTVRWRESVEFMVGNGLTLFVECGAGKVLTGLSKRIAPGTTGLTVGVPADLEIYRNAIAG
jgi:[acyl-carrier-protein] S-malonyltransferase